MRLGDGMESIPHTLSMNSASRALLAGALAHKKALPTRRSHCLYRAAFGCLCVVLQCSTFACSVGLNNVIRKLSVIYMRTHSSTLSQARMRIHISHRVFDSRAMQPGRRRRRRRRHNVDTENRIRKTAWHSHTKRSKSYIHTTYLHSRIRIGDPHKADISHTSLTKPSTTTLRTLHGAAPHGVDDGRHHIVCLPSALRWSVVVEKHKHTDKNAR